MQSDGLSPLDSLHRSYIQTESLLYFLKYLLDNIDVVGNPVGERIESMGAICNIVEVMYSITKKSNDDFNFIKEKYND